MPLAHRCLMIFCLLISIEVTAQSEITIAIGDQVKITNEMSKTYVEKIEQAFQLAGLSVNWLYLPPERALRSAAAGVVGGDALRTPQAVEPYLDLIQIPVTVSTEELWIVVSEDMPCFDQKDISFKKPVGVNGVKYFKRIYELSDTGYEEVRGPLEMVKMLKSGRADYTVFNTHVMSLFNRFTMLDLKTCGQQPFFDIYLYTYLHRKHADLVPQLTAAYQEIFNQE